jgi:trigger factor
MNITQETIDDLNAVISIKVEPQDYQNKVKSVLNNYRKSAAIPGFRKGHVPFGMVKKMYGESVMADEINKLLNEKLYEYIQQEKIEVLGNPIPSKDDEQKESLIDGESYEFKYDIGLSPQFEVNLNGKTKIDYSRIKVDDELLDKYVTDLTRRYGSMKDVDVVGESDMVNGELDELDEAGNKVEGGIHSHTSIAIDYLETAKSKKALVGKKKGDTLVIDPRDYSKGDDDLATMLHIKKEEVANVSNKFQLTISRIHELTPSEVNQEFFDKIFGPEQVKSEEEFRSKLGEDLAKTLESDSDRLFLKDLQGKLKDKLKVQLPEEFLQRWMEMSNKDLDVEELKRDWEKVADNMVWQLIESRIIKETETQVTQEEAMTRTKDMFKSQMASYGSEIDDEDLENAARNYLTKNQQDAENIYQQLYSEKLLKHYKETVSLKEKEVSFDDFVKLATGNKPKKGFLDTLSNMVRS